ncbi:hypothetical protein KDW_06830 [Dictyobacter vulcani]|uniref:Uncharacterized protein n=1 Tax=Dictyobacter vulcani TaxID=2607529 RepID=A0A5J4KK22_9CHLR|nr:helix-turn-helix domain-containing protein [Dictyobacter vulcani]GER86521.1 hypothetical protein KDW_06830 [Dictyobacter vulcani]
MKQKIFETDDEHEANAYEKQFIAQCDQQYLTNRTKGGGPEFSKRDPYARIKYRHLYYSPPEAREKLGISSHVWVNLAHANVLKFYQVEGCTLPVLSRQEIDAFAERIQKETYPIEVWEMPSRTQAVSSINDTPSLPTPKEQPYKSRLEMLQDAKTFALEQAQQTEPSYLCYMIGAYEKTAEGHGQPVQRWEIHIQVHEEQLIYTVEFQQGRFVLIKISITP